MPLQIGGSGSSRSFCKYNSKADKWFVRGAEGDREIPRPTFLIDLANIRTGWLRFVEGQAPERTIDPALDRVAPNPGQGFKRGFVVNCYSPKFFGGLVELSSASVHTANAIREVYAVFEEQAGAVENRGKVPLVACTGSEAMKDRYGTNYKPKLELIRWVDRPAELPDVSPVDEAEVWKGKEPEQNRASAASHVPPPAARAPAADPALQTDF